MDQCLTSVCCNDSSVTGGCIMEQGIGAESRGFGRNVSRLMNRFLLAESIAPTESTRVPFAGIKSSPEIKRKRDLEMQVQAASVDHVAPVRAEPTSSDVNSSASKSDENDHIARFRNTRALFEKIAEQGTKKESVPKCKSIGRSCSESPSSARRLSSDSKGRQSVSSINSDSDSNSVSVAESCAGDEQKSTSDVAVNRNNNEFQNDGILPENLSRSLDLNSCQESPLAGSQAHSASVPDEKTFSKPCVPPVPMKPHRVIRNSGIVNKELSNAGNLKSVPVSTLTSQLSQPDACQVDAISVPNSDAITSSSNCSSENFPAARSRPHESRTVENLPSDVILCRNRYNLDKNGPGRNCAAGGVLLPKRRSRDENSLFKDDLEATLSEADDYWKRINAEEMCDGPDVKMSESTYSSGSGEEMARSDSNHDLSAPPLSPVLSDSGTVLVGWTAKFLTQAKAFRNLSDSKISDSSSTLQGSVSDCESSTGMIGSVVDCDFKDRGTEKDVPCVVNYSKPMEEEHEPIKQDQNEGCSETCIFDKNDSDQSCLRGDASILDLFSGQSSNFSHDDAVEQNSTFLSVRNSACSDDRSSDSASTVILNAISAEGGDDKDYYENISGSVSSDDADTDYVLIDSDRVTKSEDSRYIQRAPENGHSNVCCMTSDEQEALLSREYVLILLF